MSSRSLISSMATTVVSQAFHWIDILEKEFDKAFVDLDMLINENDFDQYEVADDLRAKMNTMNSCFAQLVHKTQTISQMNAKLEAKVIDLQSELLGTKADRKSLDESMQTILTQLHTARLECEMLKNEDIHDADLIRQKLEEQICKQREEFKQNLMSDIQAREYEKENEKLKNENIDLQSEIYGLRLTTKYLDKELAGRIQQIQLLNRDTRDSTYENLWNQLESEIHLNRHKTVIRACRGKEILNKDLAIPPGHDPKKHQGVGEMRTVKLQKQAKEPLGISITGGKEHGLPILISEISKTGLAYQSGQLFVGDSILSVNKYDLRNVKHADAVKILSTMKGDITLTVVYVAPDDSDEEELVNCEPTSHLKYQFFDYQSIKNMKI